MSLEQSARAGGSSSYSTRFEAEMAKRQAAAPSSRPGGEDHEAVFNDLMREVKESAACLHGAEEQQRVSALLSRGKSHSPELQRRIASILLGKRGETTPDGVDVNVEVQAVKNDPPQGLFYGWASVCSVNGVPVQDLQGDMLDEHEMEAMAFDFMENARIGSFAAEDRGLSRFNPLPGAAEFIIAATLTERPHSALASLAVGLWPDQLQPAPSAASEAAAEAAATLRRLVGLLPAPKPVGAVG